MSYDTIVIGLGAMGAATLWQLARRGERVLGLDRWDPPHQWGSTHGETRITRLAIGEGEQYVPLVRRSHAIWRELEAETGEELLTQCGALIVAGASARAAAVHGKVDFLGKTIAIAERCGIAHEVLDADEIRRRFPQFRPAGDETAYWEPEGGFLRPERCVAAQLGLARRLGADVQGQTEVIGIERDGEGVVVRTVAGDRLRAGRAVLAAGAWSPGLAGPAGRHFHLTRQVFHWFTPDDKAAFAPERFPIFIWMQGAGAADGFYGFPIPPGLETIKLGREQYGEVTADPASLRREVADEEGATLVRLHVAARLPGLSAAPVRSLVCPYTNSADGDFVVTPLPSNERVLLLSACSGHGFKHSAGLGEAVAARLAGEAAPILDGFVLPELLAAE